MPNSRLVVFQNLVVDSVEHEGHEMRVRVSDAHGPRGTVTYSLTEGAVPQETVATLHQWRQRATPLTYVRRRDRGALIDDRSLIRRAFEEPGLGG